MMKPWYQSKTIIFNALAAALMALEASTGLLKEYVSQDFWIIMAVGLPVINAILRTITQGAIK
jgi:hypothetical protein